MRFPVARAKRSSTGRSGPSPAIVRCTTCPRSPSSATAFNSTACPFSGTRRPMQRISGSVRGRAAPTGRGELLDRYTDVDDVELFPCLGIAQRHQLAACKVADADHEAGMTHLLGEAKVADVEELGWAVHGEAPRPGMVRFDRRAEVGGQQRDVCGDIGEVDVDVAQATAPTLTPEHHRLAEIEDLPQTAPRAGWCEAQCQSEG